MARRIPRIRAPASVVAPCLSAPEVARAALRRLRRWATAAHDPKEVMEALKRPTWPGPKREPPQPEGEAKALKMLVDSGILSPAAAAAQLDGDTQ